VVSFPADKIVLPKTKKGKTVKAGVFASHWNSCLPGVLGWVKYIPESVSPI